MTEEAEVIEDENLVEEEATQEPESEEEIVVVTSESEENEDKEEEQQAPSWVRELRKSHRETVRENRALKEKIQSLEKPKAETQLGKKPRLDDPDIDYDQDKYEQELSAWYERKRKVDEETSRKEQEEKEAQESWTNRLNAYSEEKSGLKLKDYEEAEAETFSVLNQTQQGIIIQGAEKPALVIYALGKNEKAAEKLASIKDPIKFSFAIAKFEKELKVERRKTPPAPEKADKSTAPISGTVDSTLERLRAEAEKTGNYTKVTQYKKQMRERK